MTTKKFINLNTRKHTCEASTNYFQQENLALSTLLNTSYGCSSPFIPAEFRRGFDVCRNKTTGKKVQAFIKTSTGSWTTNIWSKDYFFKPPCIYNTYDYSKFDFNPPKITQRYLTEKEVKEKKPRSFSSKQVDIFFVSKMSVTEQFLSYTFLNYVAESGGFVGLFLGYSLLQITELLKFVRKY